MNELSLVLSWKGGFGAKETLRESESEGEGKQLEPPLLRLGRG
jgi:hypothetical protein